jgi:hypothetical protein
MLLEADHVTSPYAAEAPGPSYLHPQRQLKHPLHPRHRAATRARAWTGPAQTSPPGGTSGTPGRHPDYGQMQQSRRDRCTDFPLGEAYQLPSDVDRENRECPLPPRASLRRDRRSFSQQQPPGRTREPSTGWFRSRFRATSASRLDQPVPRNTRERRAHRRANPQPHAPGVRRWRPRERLSS